MSEPLLKVEDLRTYFHTQDGCVKAVDGLSFTLERGETLGIVGESGCGKSVACLSILRLLDPPGRIEPGSQVVLRGRDLLAVTDAEMRAIRGNEVAMIFQEPATALNPVWAVGDQIAEVVRVHWRASRSEARKRAVEMLRLVGMANAERRLDDYPHEFSGGMRQRAMIAMALACDPDLLIADEPTTALDVTTQADILTLLSDLQQGLGMGMIFVSHDLGVVSKVADRVIVMYAGQVVESGPAGSLFEGPRHPYSEGLLDSIPRTGHRLKRLAVIPGSPPNPLRWPSGCRFHPRCMHAWNHCRDHLPSLPSQAHASRCWLEQDPGRRSPPESGPPEER